MPEKKVTNTGILKITDRMQFRNKLSKTSPEVLGFVFFFG